MKKPSRKTVENAVLITGCATLFVGSYILTARFVQHGALIQKRLNEAVYILSVVEKQHPGVLDEALEIIGGQIADAEALGGELIIPMMEAIA
jgi:hypothetical protein